MDEDVHPLALEDLAVGSWRGLLPAKNGDVVRSLKEFPGLELRDVVRLG
jgi:hypothetical protein